MPKITKGFGPGVQITQDEKGNPLYRIPAGTEISTLPLEIQELFAGAKVVTKSEKRMPRQAFFLPPSLFEATSYEEVTASFNDMLELGIAKPPYPEFDIIIKAINAFKPPENMSWDDADWIKEADIIYRFHNASLVGFFISDSRGWMSDLFDQNANPKRASIPSWTKFLRDAVKHSVALYKVLIVLLATKNVEKSVKVNKLAKLGIGKPNKRHWYTTSLTIGKISETTESSPTGRSLRPHLRRGHKRNQRFGPERKFTKVVWIEPTFVNADEDFISSRTGYNVSLGGG